MAQKDTLSFIPNSNSPSGFDLGPMEGPLEVQAHLGDELIEPDKKVQQDSIIVPVILKKGKENLVPVRRSARKEAKESAEKGYYRSMEKGAARLKINGKDKLRIDFEAKRDDINHQLAMVIVSGLGIAATEQIGQAFQEAATKDVAEKSKDLQALTGHTSND